MRTLNVDELTRELSEQTVTINGTGYRLVLKDNAVNRRLRDDSRQLARLGRKADELGERTKALEKNGSAGEDEYSKLAEQEEKLEDEVIALRRRMIGSLIRDDEGKPPSSETLDALDAAVIGRLFEFVLADPLSTDRPDPTEPTANGGGTPPA